MRVMTNGCFDLFHLGHLQMLNFASSLGNELYVGINSDSSIRMLKGPSRPIMNEGYRLSFVQSLPYVTEAKLFNETRCTHLISEWKPDVYVKSDDYSFNSLDINEKNLLLKYNTKIEFMKISTDISTTSIIDIIKNI